MSQITYTGDGKTKIFYFTFPFFQKSDVRVAVDGDANAPGWAVQTAKPDTVAYFPYTGGAISFSVAPADGAAVKIYREFVMERPVSYQQAQTIKPDDLNRDFNFNLENMKDFRELLNGMNDRLTNATDLPDIGDLTDQINAAIAAINAIGDMSNIATASDLAAINASVAAVIARVMELEGRLEWNPFIIGKIQSDISALQTAMANLTTQIASMPTGGSGGGLPTGADYIASRNDYTNYTDAYGNVCATYHEDVWASGKKDIIATGIAKTNASNCWYRKSQTGFIEQGGQSSGSGTTTNKIATLPVPMANTTYHVNSNGTDAAASGHYSTRVVDKTTTTVSFVNNYLNGTTVTQSSGTISWEVKGMAA